MDDWAKTCCSKLPRHCEMSLSEQVFRTKTNAPQLHSSQLWKGWELPHSIRVESVEMSNCKKVLMASTSFSNLSETSEKVFLAKIKARLWSQRDSIISPSLSLSLSL